MIKGLILLLVAVAVKADFYNPEHIQAWTEFKRTYGKVYSTPGEESARLGVFIENLKFIENHNSEFAAGRQTYSVQMNSLGDMTAAERFARLNGYKKPQGLNNPSCGQIFKPSGTPLPQSLDWRDKGYVTPVKDQGPCGSCWAFSATGSLEGQTFKKTGKLVSLSEQNLVDCSRKQGNEGCNGGWMNSAFQYVKDNKGIDTEESYPYEARDRPCRFKPETVGAQCTGCVDIRKSNETELQLAIAQIGPISVAIDASGPGFSFYHDGVYSANDCGNTEFSLNHGVLAVGFGTNDKNQQYYIVKNSWGLSFGNKGYILMARNQNNHCGIALDASYPTV